MGILVEKITKHRRAYEAIGEIVPPLLVTLGEWRTEYNWLKNQMKDPSKLTEMLDIEYYVGVQIVLVMPLLGLP